MSYLNPLIRFGIGFVFPPGQKSDLQVRAIWGVSSLALTSPLGVEIIKKAIISSAAGAWSASNWLRIGAPLVSGGRSILAVGSAAGGMGVGTFAASLLAGAALGAIVGTGISYVVWGEKGMEDAIDFYSNPTDIPRKYIEVVAPALKEVSTAAPPPKVWDGGRFQEEAEAQYGWGV